uniref:atherin-like n=1 Tax=Agelaius phoeniceus TaxID=39638 RepID=UPI0023ED7A84|nr:atherin-like [Agelaius phoeniceus]
MLNLPISALLMLAGRGSALGGGRSFVLAGGTRRACGGGGRRRQCRSGREPVTWPRGPRPPPPPPSGKVPGARGGGRADKGEPRAGRGRAADTGTARTDTGTARTDTGTETAAPPRRTPPPSPLRLPAPIAESGLMQHRWAIVTSAAGASRPAAVPPCVYLPPPRRRHRATRRFQRENANRSRDRVAPQSLCGFAAFPGCGGGASLRASRRSPAGSWRQAGALPPHKGAKDEPCSVPKVTPFFLAAR